MTRINTLIGVPGSGKTTTIANFVKEGKLDLNNIVFTSLTNATIRAFLTKIGMSKKFLSIRTVYGLAYKELEDNLLLDDWKLKMIKGYAFEKRLKKYIVDEFNANINIIKDVKNALTYVVLSSIEDGINIEDGLFRTLSELELLYNQTVGEIVEYLIEEYNHKKYYDFTLMLYEAFYHDLDIFKVYSPNEGIINSDPEYIIFDEFQDVPFVIYRHAIKKNKKVILSVGDPEQAIFTWLRPRPRWVIKLSNLVRIKDVSYRFGRDILYLANLMLKKLGVHYKIKSAKGEGKVSFLEYTESNLITKVYQLSRNHKEVAILTRTRAEAYEIYNVLSRYDQKYYNVVNLEIFDYERVLSLMQKYQEIINKKETILDYIDQTRKLKELQAKSKIQSKIISSILNNKPLVFISTVHNVKGLEFDSVVYIDYLPRKVERLIDEDLYTLEDELRVSYVAITRAKRDLIIMKKDSSILEQFDIY